MSGARNTFKLAVVLIFSLLLGAMFAVQGEGQEAQETRPSSGQVRAENAERLPEGEGRSLMLQACVQCHDFKNIVSQRKTLTGWRRTVDEMIWHGAPLMPGEAEVISNYLAASFSPDKPAVKSGKGSAPGGANELKFAEYLPGGKGRALVLQSCVECHDLENIVSMRAKPDEWRLTVKKMVRLGARLSTDQAQTIINYLTQSLGPDKPLPDALKNSREQGMMREAPNKRVASSRSE